MSAKASTPPPRGPGTPHEPAAWSLSQREYRVIVTEEQLERYEQIDVEATWRASLNGSQPYNPRSSPVVFLVVPREGYPISVEATVEQWLLALMNGTAFELLSVAMRAAKGGA